MLVHEVAYEGCTDTVSESALKVDSGRKIPCRSGESNPSKRCVYSALYQHELHCGLTEFVDVTWMLFYM